LNQGSEPTKQIDTFPVQLLDKGDMVLWNTLISLAKTCRPAFDLRIKQLIADTRTVDNNAVFLEQMADVHQALLAASNGQFDPATFSLAHFTRVAPTSTGIVLCRELARLPAAQQAQMLTIIRTLAGETSAIVRYTGRAISVFTQVRGSVVLVTLSAVYLGWEAFQSIRQWWCGKISGKRCAKQVIDATVTLAAGLGGGVGGAAIGSLAGPVGSIAGALIGGLIASITAEKLIDWLTQKIFDLPKDVAVERAYNYLGVRPSASNSDINAAFHRLCLLHHPDKGGNKEKFFELQSNMSIIKLHRGE
jgi:DnaJ domain